MNKYEYLSRLHVENSIQKAQVMNELENTLVILEALFNGDQIPPALLKNQIDLVKETLANATKSTL